MNDPDAMWKPGYDGPPPIVRASREQSSEQSPDETDRDEPADHRARSWWIGVGVILGLLAIAAVVVVDPLDSGPVIARPDPSVFGGPADRRLPGGAAPLWSVDLQSNGEHWVDVIGRELVLAAVAEPIATPLDADGPSTPVTTIVALDAPTGEQRWTLRLPARPSEVAVIGAVEDVLVLEQPGVDGPTVTGVDVETGETRWSAEAALNDGHVGLIGTPFIARLPVSPDRLVSLVDAVSGRVVGTIVSESTATGRPAGWSTDRRGRWYVIDGDEVVEYDLKAELGEAMVIGRLDDVSTPRIVVDSRLAVVDESGAITIQAVGARSPLTVSADVPEPVRSMTPVSGSNFVVTTPGSIAGVSVEGDTADVTWSRTEGAVVADHPVEGGTLLQVATRGGAATQLVDGLTGETVEHLTMVPGALQELVVAGDGIVALRTSELGAELAGIDLDGTERWLIPGSMPVVVGDRIVVR
ncbi:MAG TPA: PQQ-binding-like beta-propeller repeat protein, partial [Ilumatobacteraceae bacterium]|nr:PQQ-binding-like beta-propeller repeat protein [Ilumatobacteraceae bacterium]